MINSSLKSISPVDGRYSKLTSELQEYFSEFALMRYRVMVETEYFIALHHLPLKELKQINAQNIKKLRQLYHTFSEADATKIKEYEKVSNHDIKAVEYYLKEKFDDLKLTKYNEFIHFGLTSQDINNTALPLMIKDAQQNVLLPLIEKLTTILNQLAVKWKKEPMLAFTHGQPASPTTMGKEILVFVERLKIQTAQLKSIPYSAKFGGVTGNFNAHHVAYPDIKWIEFADNFVNKTLGLKRSRVTTQIEHYDNMAAFCDAYKRINTILIDLCRDMWLYISMHYFSLAIVKHEVGSSAMPHKVNPIDFENAEGNLGLANAIFEHLSAKLPISRLQRDLSDSTVSRNMGVPLAHTLIALKSLMKGLSKISLNKNKLKQDLENNWIILAEAIQTVLRKEGYDKPYEKLKEFTRTTAKIDKEQLHIFIDTLDIKLALKKKLKSISPYNYIGIIEQYYQ